MLCHLTSHKREESTHLSWLGENYNYYIKLVQFRFSYVLSMADVGFKHYIAHALSNYIMRPVGSSNEILLTVNPVP